MQRMRTTNHFTGNSDCIKGVDNIAFSAILHRAFKGCFKLVAIISFAVTMSLVFTNYAKADELDNQYNELYDLLQVEQLEDKAGVELKSYGIDFTNSKSLWQINGFDLLKSIFANNLSIDGTALNLIVMVIVITVLHMSTRCFDDKTNGVSATYRSILTVFCALIIITPISSLFNNVVEVVKSCTIFMTAFIPIYSALIVSVGYAATSASYSALMFIVTQAFTMLADGVLMPVGCVALVTSVAASFNNVAKKYFEFLRKSIVFVLTSAMGIFITALNLQSVVSAPSDTIGLKTVKTALGTMIPFVGSALSDSVSILLAGAGTLKSTVGVYAVVVIVVAALPTVIKLVVWRAALAASAALVELGGLDCTFAFIKSVGSIVSLLIALVLCVSVAYLLSVILTLSIGV